MSTARAVVIEISYKAKPVFYTKSAPAGQSGCRSAQLPGLTRPAAVSSAKHLPSGIFGTPKHARLRISVFITLHRAQAPTL
jgi:hypothetical protein